MKNLLFLFLAILFAGCSNSGVLVTFDDEKSNAIREHYQNYLNNDVAALQSLWSPDLKIYMNSVEASGVADISDLITVQHQVFDNISMSFQDDGADEDLGVWVQTINYPHLIILKCISHMVHLVCNWKIKWKSITIPAT